MNLKKELKKLRDWLIGYDNIDLPLTERELELIILKRKYFCRISMDIKLTNAIKQIT